MITDTADTTAPSHTSEPTKQSPVVTRFAPSPTGYLHIGSLRTVLYNYLYTKKRDGKFMLRIEDTDRSRYVEGSIENLLQVLASVWLIPDEWPNNPWDNGPYLQSERLEIYQKYIQELLDKDMAYYCFCTPERLEELRAEQTGLWIPTKYDKKCRYLEPSEVEKRLAAGDSYTIRLKVPENQKVTFHDTIRGDIEVDTKDIDDQVLIKSDGFPTYHFAVVVDDYLMGVTDIIRGDEWIPSTPKHVLLYDAFWWKKPNFSHVPPLVWENKKKLSKRTGDVSVETFLEKWYIPEALLNYIALLGWNPKTTQEIFSIPELIEAFNITDVHRAGAVFDTERLDWFNGKYINNYESETLYNKLLTYLKRYDPIFAEQVESYPKEYNLKILDEVKTRMKKLSDYKLLTSFLYNDATELKEDMFMNEKMKISSLDDVKKSLEFALDVIAQWSIDFNSPESIKESFISSIKQAEMKNGQVLWPVRVALSMEQFSPGALELIYILGREKSIERIEKVLNQIS